MVRITMARRLVKLLRTTKSQVAHPGLRDIAYTLGIRHHDQPLSTGGDNMGMCFGTGSTLSRATTFLKVIKQLHIAKHPSYPQLQLI
jgi:hypothetical protein